jgi:hypothetical protein
MKKTLKKLRKNFKTFVEEKHPELKKELMKRFDSGQHGLSFIAAAYKLDDIPEALTGQKTLERKVCAIVAKTYYPEKDYYTTHTSHIFLSKDKADEFCRNRNAKREGYWDTEFSVEERVIKASEIESLITDNFEIILNTLLGLRGDFSYKTDASGTRGSQTVGTNLWE